MQRLSSRCRVGVVSFEVGVGLVALVGHAAVAHAQTAVTTAPAPAVAPATNVAALVMVGLFFAAFFALGVLVLKKKRAERIGELTRELDKPNTSDVLPPASAEALVEAERQALKLKSAAEQAAREALRAKDSGDEDKAQLAAAKQQQAAQALAEVEQRRRALRDALTKTRDGVFGKLRDNLKDRTLDQSALDDIETILFGSDIGARTAERLLESVRQKLSRRELSDVNKLEEALMAEAKAILTSVKNEPLSLAGETPRIILVLGVNGAGKTTTIGKLSAQLKASGKRVLLGAGDTFRAAAADQLEVWAKRADVPIVVGPDNADPSSVLFDAAKRGKDEGFDVVICDTAGRLHTKINLMEELKKVARTLNKAVPGAPHEVLLVLDSTVGQNAIAQAKQFSEAAPLTGIVLTKLDGTAKGGVILGIIDELKVPVRYIGIGEGIGDLRTFDADTFLEALFA